MKFVEVIFVLLLVSISINGLKTLLPSIKRTKSVLQIAQREITTIGQATVSAKKLRDLILLDSNGAKKKVSQISGESESIIVFLRHLG